MKRLALLAALAFATTAGADTTLHYTVQHAGKTSGAQTTVIGDDGRVNVSFSYRDNGRGPDLSEEIRVAADGTIRSYRLKGKSTFGAVLDERFTLARGRASWRSPSEHGESKPDGPAMYLPNDGSPEVRAMIVRASQRQPAGRIAALPGGELQSARIAGMRVGPAGQEREVALYSILGLGMQPAYVWLDDDAGMRLFARISPGGSHVIAQGYEAWSPKLEERQVAAATEFLHEVAAQDARRLPEPVLIRDVRVFDAASAALGPPSDVYLFGGRIASVYPAGSPAQDAATVIEGGGRALLPGLFDMHAHEDAWNAALQIAGGVTTSRDMGNDNALLADLIARIGHGELIGPRIVPAGFIEGESPFAARGGFVVNNLEEADKAVDWYAQRGYRQIKLYNSIHPDWVAPIAAYAHSRGLRVSGHVPAFSRAERAVREGYDELQHINQLMLNFVSDPDTDSRTLARFILVGERAQALDLDSKAVHDFIALLAERQTVIDATLATFEGMYTQGQGEMDPAMAPIADHVPFATQRSWRGNSMEVSGEKLKTYRASYARMIEFVGRLHAAGVPMVAGTDNIAGFTLHRELELYVKAGLTPGEAIRIATENGARYTGLSAETGTIERGKLADLILVDGDPTQNISDIRRVSLVITRGVAYAPAEVYESFGVKRFADPPRITVAGD
jgi:cytosine/adenosine deaminase-related metal-dependent hydrolase